MFSYAGKVTINSVFNFSPKKKDKKVINNNDNYNNSLNENKAIKKIDLEK